MGMAFLVRVERDFAADANQKFPGTEDFRLRRLLVNEDESAQNPHVARKIIAFECRR
jgi:hypothetical protein